MKSLGRETIYRILLQTEASGTFEGTESVDTWSRSHGDLLVQVRRVFHLRLLHTLISHKREINVPEQRHTA